MGANIIEWMFKQRNDHQMLSGNENNVFQDLRVPNISIKPCHCKKYRFVNMSRGGSEQYCRKLKSILFNKLQLNGKFDTMHDTTII